MTKNISQDYPRINDERSKDNGLIDESQLVEHKYVITQEEIGYIIKQAVLHANQKSSSSILNIPNNLEDEKRIRLYKEKGKELFKYFQRYCGDPASSAYNCLNRNYEEIAKEQFRNWTLQKERMNAGWRYQFIARDAALKSKRFISVSDIGTNEADFNAKIAVKNCEKMVSIYVSVKNRTNTMGGQDWPKAIRALEEVAKKDKNRIGPFLCVFGIAMEKGMRLMKTDSKTKRPFSENTEIWKSNFFWPFFANLSYDEIIKSVLTVLIEIGDENKFAVNVPNDLIYSFGDECKKYHLIDNEGNFNDPYRLVDFFCKKLRK